MKFMKTVQNKTVQLVKCDERTKKCERQSGRKKRKNDNEKRSKLKV